MPLRFINVREIIKRHREFRNDSETYLNVRADDNLFMTHTHSLADEDLDISQGSYKYRRRTIYIETLQRKWKIFVRAAVLYCCRDKQQPSATWADICMLLRLFW